MIKRIRTAIKRALLRRLLDITHRWIADAPPAVLLDAFRQTTSHNHGVLARATIEARALLGERLTPADRALFDIIDAAIPPEARPN